MRTTNGYGTFHGFGNSGCAAVLTCALLGAGCFPEGGDGEGPEQVRLAISVVPDDVECVRVRAAGASRTVLKEIDAVPGMPLQKSFSGLPLGPVVFSAEAFTSACAAVAMSTIPQWASDEVPVSIVLGRLSTVALTLHRNGRAKVGVDFADEPVCSPVGAACLTSSECCAKDCHRGVCRVAPDGGAAAEGDADAGAGGGGEAGS
jgi:hypothetical protein